MPDTQLVRRTERLAAVTGGIARAADLLRSGALVAFGTETVYGLGADATDAGAVARLFEAKGRPRFNPLIVHVPDEDAAFREVDAVPAARRLARAFWPGPLTIVAPRRPASRVAALAGAGLSTLGVRVPAPDAARALLAAVARPVAAPSANRSGRISPSRAEHVLAELDGLVDAVLDCGPCGVGVESTVVMATEDGVVLLRPGGVTREALQDAGIRVVAPDETDGDGSTRSPGQMSSHYAPDLPLRLEADSVAPDEVLLAFGAPLPGAAATWNLSETGDLRQAAGRLFLGLREIDRLGREVGAVRLAAMPVPGHGLGEAIRDRLRRAAAPRGPAGIAPRAGTAP